MNIKNIGRTHLLTSHFQGVTLHFHHVSPLYHLYVYMSTFENETKVFLNIK